MPQDRQFGTAQIIAISCRGNISQDSAATRPSLDLVTQNGYSVVLLCLELCHEGADRSKTADMF